MADGRGGYRAPRKPAAVSGPGRLSRRTDGRQPKQQLPDAAYGEQATFQADQSGAPMDLAPGALNAPTIGGAGAAPSPVDLSQVQPFGAPTGRPDEPVTSGANSGPGPGLSSLGLDQSQDPGTAYVRRVLPTLEIASEMPGATFAMRQMVRRLRAIL